MAYTQNQLTDAFQSSLGRTPTPYEMKTYATVSPQTLAGLKDTYTKYNVTQSLSDYLKHSGIDPATAGQLGQKYGISGIGTAAGNTALLTALRSGAPQASAPALTGSISPAAAQTVPTMQAGAEQPPTGTTGAPAGTQPQVETPGTATYGADGTYTGTIPGSISAAAGGSGAVTQDPIAASTQMVQMAYDTQQKAQQAVAAIDAQLAQVKSDKMAEIARSGGVVNEASLESEVLRENEPLLARRKELAAEYTQANQAYQKAVQDKNAADSNANKAKTLSQGDEKISQGQEKIDNQQSQAEAKFEQAGWKQTKVNQYDEYGNVTGQIVQWSQNPADGGGSSSTGNVSGIATSGGGSNAAANILPGATDTSIPLSQAISTYGIDAIVAGIIKNEGGSVPGVQNNPGNIKFMGLPGQTDSKISNDGGKSTFANYASIEAGKAAIASIVQNAANGKSSIYGASPSFQDFVNKYTNTLPNKSSSGAVSNSSTPAVAALDTGSKVNVTGVGYSTSEVTLDGKNTQLTQATIDDLARTAIMNGGALPSAVPRATKGVAAVQRDAVLARIGQLDPGGNLQANKIEAAAWGASLKKQIDYTTGLARSLASADADLQQVVTTFKGKVNDSNMPIANILANYQKYGLGDGDVIAYRASLAEIQRVYAQVFSTGGSVQGTNIEAKDIIDGNISVDNLAQVASQLQKLGAIDVQKANDSITSAEGNLNNIASQGASPGASEPSQLPQYLQDKISGHITQGDQPGTAYLPRAVWDSLGADKDAVLAEAAADGVKLLIK